jgi:hypothetical protein
MSAPIDTVSWCAPGRFHQPFAVCCGVVEPNWKAGCAESVPVRFGKGCDTKLLTDMSKLKGAARPHLLRWVSYPDVGQRLWSLFYEALGTM